jgi:hypothetical protein
MSEKQLFLVIAIVCLIGFIIFKLFNIEGFTDAPTTAPTTAPSVPLGCPTESPKNWWEIDAPKQVVSYITGVRFPVTAIEPNKAIKSPFQIPFIKSGNTESSGCIVVLNSGTYTTKMCNVDSSEQRWNIIQINDAATFEKLIKNGRDYYSGIRSTLDLPQGIQYGFFMIISEKDPSMALSSNGGNLTVQRIGNYSSQFWDITKDVGSANIVVYDVNENTTFSSNYVNPLSLNAGAQYQYPGVSSSSSTGTSSSQSASYPSSSPSPSASSSNVKPFSINLNLNNDLLGTMFGELETTGPGVTLPPSSEAFANTGNNSKCKPCPSILLDYIAKNEIPCLGCKL